LKKSHLLFACEPNVSQKLGRSFDDSLDLEPIVLG
jgi:hypothetical protein